MFYFFEQFGVSVAAITGVLAARGKPVDLFGVIVLALVTSFGGGTIRDVCLGDFPVVWIRDPNYLLNAVAVGFATFFIIRHHEIPRTVLLVADAFVLALYTIVGAQKAIDFNVAGSIAVTMGVITGVAGGIFRDLLTGEIPMVFRKEIYIYATASFFGALIFVPMVYSGIEHQLCIYVGTLVTLILRLVGIRWKITLPVIKAKESEPVDLDG